MSELFQNIVVFLVVAASVVFALRRLLPKSKDAAPSVPLSRLKKSAKKIRAQSK